MIFVNFDAVNETIFTGKPYDISSGSEDVLCNVERKVKYPNGNKVLCSIMLDVNILDTISKIITRMVTCNQCLLQASNLNVYE